MTGADVPEAEQAAPRSKAESGLWNWSYGLLLTLLAMVQSPGLMVADTKFDLFVAPGRFLGRASSMWDGTNAFGQIQNQAYGYFFPMGPFFWLGQQTGIGMWVVQRLWWALLLCLAFYGVLKVARELSLGTGWSRVLAGFSFALAVHMTSIIGPSSAEAWPSAMVPWVLWCLVKGSKGGSERRWAACAGLFTALAGGVNAVAVSVVLPLGVCWLLTRGGPRKWRLFGWWVVCTLLATLWWLVPLLLMGGYAFPFLDYIENATITTVPTDLVDIMGGSHNWTAYVDPNTYQAGHTLGTTAFLVLDASLLAAVGLMGIARKDNPHRHFLMAGVVLGVLLVGMGYAGPGAGWFADTRQALLDGALAPFRNVHKYDAVLRLPLALGLAHVLAVWAARPSAASTRETFAGRGRAVFAGIAIAGLSTPWLTSSVAPVGAVESVPGYWTETADYLNKTSDGSRVLVVPGSAFGSYMWGEPRDDVLQPLMTTPWAVRNVVPLAEPGNVVLLDSITEAIESGEPNEQLAELLAANGIGRVVVRNDLDRLRSAAPDPVIVHQSLDNSPGFERERGFGPELGAPSTVTDDEGNRIAPNGGLSAAYPAVEVYDVQVPAPKVGTRSGLDVATLIGRPGGEVFGGRLLGPMVFAADDSGGSGNGQTILTDSLRRREESFSAVRNNASATMGPEQDWRLEGGVHLHRMSEDQERWTAVTEWQGIAGVTASSSQAWVDAPPPLVRGSHPGAALDGSADTSWRSSRGERLVDQSWRVNLESQPDVDQVRLYMGRGNYARSIRLSNGSSSKEVALPQESGWITVDTGFGPSSYLRIDAAEAFDGAEFGQMALAEVQIPGVRPQRFLRLARPDNDSDVVEVSLVRDFGTDTCLTLPKTQVCRDSLGELGDDGEDLNRRFALPVGNEFRISLEGSLRTGDAAYDRLVEKLPFDLSTTRSSTVDLRGSALAMVDGNPATTWVSDSEVEDPTIEVGWDRPREVSSVQVDLNQAAAAARPVFAEIRGGGEQRRVLVVRGRARLKEPIRADELTIELIGRSGVFDSTVSSATRLPTGVTELTLRDSNGENVLDASGTDMSEPCGSGPDVQINDTAVRTRVEGSLTDVTTGAADVLACTERVDLPAGENQVTAEPSELARVDRLGFSRGAIGDYGAVRPIPVSQWTNENRKVEVPRGVEPRLLVTTENFNLGWVATLNGTELTPQRVDGWRQGWWVPAGAGGPVELSYAPNVSYRLGLLVGLAGAVAVLVVAFRQVRGRARTARAHRVTNALAVWAVAVPAMGLLAGWVGAGVAVVGAVLHVVLRQRNRDWAGGLAAALVLAAGAATAYARSGDPTLTRGAWTHWLVAAGLVFALLALDPPKGPQDFRRSDGRSIE